eukprot:262686_1
MCHAINFIELCFMNAKKINSFQFHVFILWKKFGKMSSQSLTKIDNLLKLIDDCKHHMIDKPDEKQESYSKGLAGVIVGESKICTVGKKGLGLNYRGYSIDDLCKHCTFEEIAYLLTRNKLPTQTELINYLKKLNSYYELPSQLTQILQLIPKSAHPLDVMKIACTFLGTQFKETPNYSNKNNVFNINETLDICDRLLAIFPSIICYHYKYHFDNIEIETKPLNNNNNESIAQHIIRLLHGNKYKTLSGYKLMIDSINISLICYAEHGLAASTFSARVTTSTLSDSYSAICAAICSIKGVLHGGANEMAFQLISSFNGDINKAINGINLMLKTKQLVMGFGHRIYKNGDPRAPILKQKAKILSKQSEFGNENFMKVSDIIEKIVFDSKGIYPNMDFPAAMLFFQCGIPKILYTPIFVCSRTSGWFAHILEQRNQNRLIRPSCNYIGPNKKQFVPINKR